MQATHTLDGQDLERRGPDRFGRFTYYDVKTGEKVSVKGKEGRLVPIEGAQTLQEKLTHTPAFEQEPVPVPGEFPFMAAAVAMSAILSGHGYHERGGFCANRCGDRAAILSMPHDGGHKRYRIEFPELMAIPAEEEE